MNLPNSYRVEVSGWDAKENFFVEKTVLEWQAGDKKDVVLRTSIRVGCVVFVRLLRPLAAGATFPIAYQAISNHMKDNEGANHISIERLRPRTAYHGTPSDQKSVTRVA